MKKMLCALLALLLTLSLAPAAWAAGFDTPFEAPAATGLGIHLRDFVDEKTHTLTIAGSSIDLDQVCFLDPCEVGDELEICLARSDKTAFVMDEATLPPGCKVELRSEPPKDDMIGGREQPADKRPADTAETCYLYLTGKPTQAGNYMFFFWADMIYFANIEVNPASSTTAFALAGPADQPAADPAPADSAWESEPFVIAPVTDPPATDPPVYVPPVTDPPVYVPPVTDPPVFVPPSDPTPYVPPQPSPTISITGDLRCRPGEEVLLEARVGNATSAAVSYQWYGSMGSFSAAIPGANGVYYQPDTSRAGTWSYYCIATVSYYANTVSVQSQPMTLTVAEPTVSSLQIAQLPTKTSYNTGDAVDLRGVRVYVIYDDGSYQLVSEGFTAYPERLTQAGTQTVWLTYGGKSCSFDVSVREAAQTVQGIGVLTPPNKTSYRVGDWLDVTGLAVRVYFSNGGTRDIYSGFSCSPKQFTQAGRQNVTVSYSGKTTTFQVNVEDTVQTIQGIGVLSLPGKTSYRVGEWLDTTGLAVRVYFSNGSSRDVYTGFSCSPQQFSRAGRQTVTVSYSGKTTSFDVTVEEEQLRVTGLDIQSLPVNRSYTVGDALNTTGLMLTVYTNRGTQTVSSGYTCTPQRLTAVGTQTVTVSYQGQSATFTVEVRESVRATPTPSPSASPVTGLGALGGASPSPSPTPVVPTSAPARRNTGVNGVVKLLFVVALVALAALIGFIWFLRRHGADEEDYVPAPPPRDKRRSDRDDPRH